MDQLKIMKILLKIATTFDDDNRLLFKDDNYELYFLTTFHKFKNVEFEYHPYVFQNKNSKEIIGLFKHLIGNDKKIPYIEGYFIYDIHNDTEIFFNLDTSNSNELPEIYINEKQYFLNWDDYNKLNSLSGKFDFFSGKSKENNNKIRDFFDEVIKIKEETY